MKIGITGSSGFIGSELTKHFLASGHEVLLMQRTQPGDIPEHASFFLFDLENCELPQPEMVDVIIHCAFVPYSPKQRNAYGVNVDATIKLQAFCRQHGKQFVFLSTMSAHSEAVSVYGKHKFELEHLLGGEKESVLKLGLVIGSSGGLFKRISEVVNSSKFIPMVGGGTQPIQTVYIQDLCKVVSKVLESRLNGNFTIGTPRVYIMKEFYQAVAKTNANNPVFVLVPYSLMYAGLFIAEKLGLNLPVGTENLLGLKQLKSFDTSEDLNKIGVSLLEMEESINSLTAS